MLKNRSMQVKLVKDSALTTEARPYTSEEIEAINKMVVRDNLKFAAVIAVSSAAAIIMFKTAASIAEKKFTS